MTNKAKLIVFPHPPGSGGPGSFQSRFEQELQIIGWRVAYEGGTNEIPDAILIVGGTKKIFWLIRMKFKNVPIIYRLDGLAWLHKKKKLGIKKRVVTDFQNLLLKITHGFIANKIIYQSKFVEQWWRRDGLRIPKETHVIYNGIKIPDSTSFLTSEHSLKKRLVVLEGNIDYSPYAIDLLNHLAVSLPKDISIEIYGNFESPGQIERLNKRLAYKSHIPRSAVLDVLFGSVYLSLDINPACPNTVIEALSVGAPVVAYDTGSISELVDNNSGVIVSYGGDPWSLSNPDVGALEGAILKAFASYETLSNGARKRAQENFSIELMIEKYLGVISNAITELR